MEDAKKCGCGADVVEGTETCATCTATAEAPAEETAEATEAPAAEATEENTTE